MSKKLTLEEFSKRANNIHHNKYLYKDYISYHKDITVTCPIHGDFPQTPCNHLNGKGCPQCAIEERSHKQSFRDGKFEEKVSKLHNNQYEYIKGEYVNAHSIIHFKCKHCGKINEMVALVHLRGTGCECQKKLSNLESEVEEILNKNDIEYIKQYRFKEWKFAPYDFYLPQANLIIECQGKQHFGEGGWSKDYNFTQQYETDKKKNDFCKEKGVNIIYFTHFKNTKDYFGDIYKDEFQLMGAIKLFIGNNKTNF